MERIVSSTSKEHVVRLLIFFIAGLGAGAYFLYDGLVGYPKHNIKVLVDGFGSSISKEDRAKLEASVRSDISEDTLKSITSGESLDAVKERIGEPGYVDDAGSLHYLGAAGILTIRNDGNRVKTPTWKTAPHRDIDLILQFVYAGICGAVALGAGVVLLRAVSLRTVVDDEGLKVAGHAKIPWDAMRALDGREYQKKGWLLLEYDDGGDVRKARLDSYKIASFREIVSAICERKGFENPLPSKSG